MGGGFGGAGGLGGATQTLTGLTTKTTGLRFIGPGGQVVESGFLEDVHIIPDVRTNSLVIAAPEQTMRLLEALIRELDTTSAAQSFVNVFTAPPGRRDPHRQPARAALRPRHPGRGRRAGRRPAGSGPAGSAVRSAARPSRRSGRC